MGSVVAIRGHEQRIATQFDIVGGYDISGIENEDIRREMYVFITDLFENGAVSARKGFANAINYMIPAINQAEYDSPVIIDTITEIDKQELDEVYCSLLKADGQIIETSRNVLLSDMKKHLRFQRTTLGGMIKRFYNFVKEYNDAQAAKYIDRNIWDLENFPIKLDTTVNSHKKLRFDQISQESIRECVKRYIFHELRVKAVSTCVNYYYQLRYFSKFLDENHPQIKKLSDVTYEVMEELYIYATNDESIGLNRRNTLIRLLQSFFWYASLMGLKGAHKKDIVIDFETRDVRLYNPKFLTDEEVKGLNAHFKYMPVWLMRMVVVLENCGMRISECLFLEQDCVRKSNDGNYYLKYRQQKTKKFNLIPLSEDVALTLLAAIDDAKSVGEDKFVFVDENNHTYTYERFRYAINKVCYENQIRNSEGGILHIKTHVFRGTLAMKYNEMGLELDVIRSLLGQSSYSALMHYVKTNSAELLEQVEPLLSSRGEMIRNMGKERELNPVTAIDKSWLPLSNGFCSKDPGGEVCDRANNCYSCSSFKPTKQHLYLYERHLREVRNSILIAEANGFERLARNAKSTENAILNVIRKVDPLFEIEEKAVL